MRLANLWTIKWTNTCNNLEVFFLSLLLFCFLIFFSSLISHAFLPVLM